MTGKDLVIYIIENNLLDEPVYSDDKLIGFMTVGEAAVKFNVGVNTIRTWQSIGLLSGIVIANELFIPANAKNPMEELCLTDLEKTQTK
jgi:hypothetical protein